MSQQIFEYYITITIKKCKYDISKANNVPKTLSLKDCGKHQQ
jgi:hypothetical protein